MIPCRVCAGPAAPAFEATVLGRHRVSYFHCGACGYLETEDFAAALEAMDEQDVNARWQRDMAPFFGERADTSLVRLEEVFHLD